jgi:hypothetical protein
VVGNLVYQVQRLSGDVSELKARADITMRCEPKGHEWRRRQSAFKMLKEKPVEDETQEGIEKAPGGPSLGTFNGSVIGAKP